MAIPIEQLAGFTNWIGSVTQPDDRECGLRVIELFDRLRERSSVTDAELSPLLMAVNCQTTEVSVVAAELLHALAVRYEPARDSIRALMRNGGRSQGLAAISFDRFDPGAPEFVMEILEAGLNHPVQDVRQVAALYAMQLDLKPLIPSMARLFDSLTDPDARHWVGWYIDLLRDGYALRSLGDEMQLAVRTDRANVMAGCYDEAEIRSRGVEAVAAEIRRKAHRDGR